MTTSKNNLDQILGQINALESEKHALHQQQASINKKITKLHVKIMALKEQYDQIQIESLEEVNWDLALKSGNFISSAICNYQDQVLTKYAMCRSGIYNTNTEQHIMQIEFTSNDDAQFADIKLAVETIFKYAKPCENEIAIIVNEAGNFSSRLTKIAYNTVKGKYLFFVALSTLRTDEREFDSVDDLLNYVRSISDINYVDEDMDD